MPTLDDWAEKGFELRAWCLDCARGEIVDFHIWCRMRSVDVIEGRARFRCTECKRKGDNILLVPATGKEVTWAQVVEYWFHNVAGPKALKRRRRD
jgi:hypothetical protein